MEHKINKNCTPPGDGDSQTIEYEDYCAPDNGAHFCCDEDKYKEKFNSQKWIKDDQTNFPLPIYPIIDAPTVYNRNGKPYHTDPDKHHVFFPRKLLISDSLDPGGKVVRYSRVQVLRRYYHNLAHKLMEPPDIPLNEYAMYELAVLALSNYIPRTAIDLRNGDIAVKELNNTEYELLRAMTEVDFTAGFQSAIGRFVIHSTVSINRRDLHKERVTQEFLNAKEGSIRKTMLGNQIIKMALDAPTHQVQNKMRDAIERREMPSTTKSAYKTSLEMAKKVKQRDRTTVLHKSLTVDT
ncbi:MAG: hypothetical protein KDJ52_34340 [Anaerolineae bacterium]|nr:hypothetical protein [Anaerolineae bacterium]